MPNLTEQLATALRNLLAEVNRLGWGDSLETKDADAALAKYDAKSLVPERIYSVQSESEEGFWSNEQGWVYDVASATKWAGEKIIDNRLRLPMSQGNDSVYIVVDYG